MGKAEDSSLCLLETWHSGPACGLWVLMWVMDSVTSQSVLWGKRAVSYMLEEECWSLSAGKLY